MRQEHVTLKNVEVERLFELIKKHLQEIELDIIHEETAAFHCFHCFRLLELEGA